MPALSDITLTLTDDTPPVIKSASGPLATAAADKSTVAGSQTLSFTAGDADSGVRSATLTLTPQDGETPYIHTFDFAAQCSYDSWNACPLTESVSEFALNTATLKDDSYTVNLTVTDAAGNTASDSLGTITTAGPPVTGPDASASGPIGPGSPLAERGPANGTNASRPGQADGPLDKHSQDDTHHHLRSDQSHHRAPDEHRRAADLRGAARRHRDPAAQGALVASLAGVRIGPTGLWTLTLRRSTPSSTIRIAYDSHINDTVPAATTSLELHVHAGIALASPPHHERQPHNRLQRHPPRHRNPPGRQATRAPRPHPVGNGSSSTPSAPTRSTTTPPSAPSSSAA